MSLMHGSGVQGEGPNSRGSSLLSSLTITIHPWARILNPPSSRYRAGDHPPLPAHYSPPPINFNNHGPWGVFECGQSPLPLVTRQRIRVPNDLLDSV